ncbi:hypothetical protein MRY87_03385 [bacterium]|nr:hypothetical protein [bacterium]
MTQISLQKGKSVATAAAACTLVGLTISGCFEDAEKPLRPEGDSPRSNPVEPSFRETNTTDRDFFSNAPLPEVRREFPDHSTSDATQPLLEQSYLLHFVRPDRSPVFGSVASLYLFKPGLRFDYRHVEEIHSRGSRNPHFEYELPGNAKPQDYSLHASYRPNAEGKISFSLPHRHEAFDWALYINNSREHVPFFIYSTEETIQPAEQGNDGELLSSEIEVPDPEIRARYFTTHTFHDEYQDPDSTRLNSFSVRILKSGTTEEELLFYDPTTRAFDFRTTENGQFSASYRDISFPGGAHTLSLPISQDRYSHGWLSPFSTDRPKVRERDWR